MSPNTESLHLTRIIPASPERVFDAWTTADLLGRWTCPDPGARVAIDIDPRKGGHYSIRMDADGGPFTAHGTYRVIDRPRRLVQTWAWAEDTHPMKEDTVVTVEFVPVEEDTEIRLTHEGFPTPADRDGHEEGWKICLGRLASIRVS